MVKSSLLIPPSGNFKGFVGFDSNPLRCPPNKLTHPSTNSLIDSNGFAGQRLGFSVETKIDLTEADNPATCFYHPKYDLTVFAVGTKLKYYDWTDQVVYDTGVTLTDGTVTRFDEYAGDIYLTNVTDGVTRIVFGRLNDAAADSGDADVTIDTDMAARLSVFGLTNDTLRIKGTNEGYASLVIATGVVTLDTTLSQSYADNSICLVVHPLTSLEKSSKVFFWKERMGLIGSEIAGNADQPNSSVYFNKFAGPATLEDIVVFSSGTGGSTIEIIGHLGSIKNVVPAKDFLYAFNETQGHSAAASDVITSGSGIGGTPFDIHDENSGCLNEDCAAIVGNNEIIYVTNDQRIMRSQIRKDTGATTPSPDEEFDVDIRDDLKDMDADQTGARVVHHKGRRRTICQIKRVGQWYWYIFDHNITNDRGEKGAWQPPQQVLSASDFFERKGVLYATDESDDTVYSVNTSFDDDGLPISSKIATGDFNVGSSTMKFAYLQGEISQASEINLQSFVTNNLGGRIAGSLKKILGSAYTYSEGHGVGADSVGGAGVEAETILTASWDKEFDIFPSEANRVQIVASNDMGGFYSVSLYVIDGIQHSKSFSKSI